MQASTKTISNAANTESAKIKGSVKDKNAFLDIRARNSSNGGENMGWDTTFVCA